MPKRRIQERVEWVRTYPVSATDVLNWFIDAPLEDSERLAKDAIEIIDHRYNERDGRKRNQEYAREADEPTHKITHTAKMEVCKPLRRRSSGG